MENRLHWPAGGGKLLRDADTARGYGTPTGPDRILVLDRDRRHMGQETEPQQRERRAQAICTALEPDRSWAGLGEDDRDRYRRAADRVAGSDASVGLMPIPVDGPYSTRSPGSGPSLSGLRAHIPSVAAFYEEAGIKPGGEGEPEALGPAVSQGKMFVVLRTLVAVAAFTAAAAALITLGLQLSGS